MVDIIGTLKKLFNYQPDESSRDWHDSDPSIRPSTAEECHYDVVWSEQDESYVATVKEFPSMSWLEETPDKALNGIRNLVRDTLEEIARGQ
jgi:hypothetical protein